MDARDLERILEAAETLSSSAAHRLAMGSDSTEACPFPTCVLSAAEHHRLAYGILAENKDLKRRLEALEHGSPEPEPEPEVSFAMCGKCGEQARYVVNAGGKTGYFVHSNTGKALSQTPEVHDASSHVMVS